MAMTHLYNKDKQSTREVRTVHYIATQRGAVPQRGNAVKGAPACEQSFSSFQLVVRSASANCSRHLGFRVGAYSHLGRDHSTLEAAQTTQRLY